MSQHRGLYFGRLLLLLAHSVRGSQPQTKQKRDFATRQFPKVPSRADWAKIVKYQNIVCLQVWKDYADVALSARSKVYDDVQNRLQQYQKNIGPIITQHSIMEKSCIGLLPAWFRMHAMIDPDGNNSEYFKRAYVMHAALKKDGL
jgi:hypothetical protein